METKQPLQACLLTAPRQAEWRPSSHAPGAPGCGVTAAVDTAERRPQREPHRAMTARPCALLQRRTGHLAQPPGAAAGRLWSAQLAALLRQIASLARRLGSGA